MTALSHYSAPDTSVCQTLALLGQCEVRLPPLPGRSHVTCHYLTHLSAHRLCLPEATASGLSIPYAEGQCPGCPLTSQFQDLQPYAMAKALCAGLA